ncbi:hypothetical protein DSL92_03960 [Billgrantia gudaonensis]|uniref:Uncharacterized protein n=1 Tax=Billgrantia gudaonensis TaxID=376427 RepID=A0A432JJJ8_9GAMM|nr:hypothetical protein DSL92_03960 [Halomonas gudaonensis]
MAVPPGEGCRALLRRIAPAAVPWAWMALQCRTGNIMFKGHVPKAPSRRQFDPRQSSSALNQGDASFPTSGRSSAIAAATQFLFFCGLQWDSAGLDATDRGRPSSPIPSSCGSGC